MASSPADVTTEQTASGLLVDERKDYRWWTDDPSLPSWARLTPTFVNLWTGERESRASASSPEVNEPDAQPEVIDLDTEDEEPDPRTEKLLTILEEHPQYPPSPRSWFGFGDVWRQITLRAQLDWMRQHFKITPKKPKSVRGRGRPKGSALLEIPIKKSVNLWMDGYTHKEIHEKVDPAGRIDPLTLKRSLQRKIQTSLPEKQAQIKAAHEAARLRKKKAQ
jgi:hypothetical protein